MNSNSEKILDLKEKIHDLREYLHSDICVSCGEAAIRLDNYITELQKLMENLL